MIKRLKDVLRLKKQIDQDTESIIRDLSTNNIYHIDHLKARRDLAINEYNRKKFFFMPWI